MFLHFQRALTRQARTGYSILAYYRMEYIIPTKSTQLFSYRLTMRPKATKTIYSEEHKRLVDRLIKAREDAHLGQEEVAKRLGRTQSYISKLESGQRRIDLIQLKDFARIYKKPLDYFIAK